MRKHSRVENISGVNQRSSCEWYLREKKTDSKISCWSPLIVIFYFICSLHKNCTLILFSGKLRFSWTELSWIVVLFNHWSRLLTLFCFVLLLNIGKYEVKWKKVGRQRKIRLYCMSIIIIKYKRMQPKKEDTLVCW